VQKYYMVKVLAVQDIEEGHKPNRPEVHKKWAGRRFEVCKTDFRRESCGCRLLRISPDQGRKLSGNENEHYLSECTCVEI
jgi:hypothetical protein